MAAFFPLRFGRCAGALHGARALDAVRPLNAMRALSAAAKTAPSYPFSKNVRALAPAPSAAALRPRKKKDTSVMRDLNTHLTAAHPRAADYLALFSRRRKDRIRPGSVLTVTSYTQVPTAENPTPQTNSFSGVLIGIKRRHQGRDLAFRLRAMVGRTGVEQYFKVFSPLIAAITVITPATTSGPPILDAEGRETGRRKPQLRAARRAKLFYMREQLDRLPNVASHVKAFREKKSKK